MPIYIYWCPNCQRQFELFSNIETRNYKFCPVCNQRLQRKFDMSAEVQIFTPADYEFDENGPVRVTSKRQLKELNKKYPHLKAVRLL